MPNNKPRLKGTSPPNTWGFKKANGEIVTSQDNIFPILKRDASGEFTLIGTGFYICPQSIFVTATHVLKDVFDEKTGQQKDEICIVHFSGDGTYLLIPITWAWHSNDADISVGKVAPATHNKTGAPLVNLSATLTLREPDINEKIVTFAYPDFDKTKNGQVQELAFRPNFYDGSVLEYYPKGRDRVIMPWPCYRTDIHLHGGSSGGPVLDKNGRVFGINCRSMDPDTDISFITPIKFILGAYIEDVRFGETEAPRKVSIKELIDRGYIFLD